MKFRKTLSAAFIAALSAQAAAASFYLVVPVGSAKSEGQKINVMLAQAKLPAASLTEPYNFDLSSVLSVTGDENYSSTLVSWQLLASALPSGLQMNNAGLISGIPTAREVGKDIEVQATYKTKSARQGYTIVVNGVPPAKISLDLAAKALPQAETLTAYNFDLTSALTVTGDPEFSLADVTWSATGLPDGMMLSTTGVLSGTLSTSNLAGVPILVTAKYKTRTGEQTYSLVINRVSVDKITMSLNAVTLPAAEVASAYSYDVAQALSVTGDPEYTTAQVTWSATGLPAGMTLSAAGILSGTPSVSQTVSIPVTATYRTKAGSRTYSLLINRVDPSKITVSLAAASLPDADVNQPYWYDLNGLLTISGDPEYDGSTMSWSATGLPSGMTLDASGILSGTPKVPNLSGASIPVTATYRTKTGTHTYSLLVKAPWNVVQYNGKTWYRVTTSMMTQANALSECQALQVNGVSGWHLTTKAEAHELRGVLSQLGVMSIHQDWGGDYIMTSEYPTIVIMSNGAEVASPGSDGYPYCMVNKAVY